MISRILLQYFSFSEEENKYLIDLCPSHELIWESEEHKKDILDSTKWDTVWSEKKFIDWYLFKGLLERDYETHMKSLVSQIKSAKKDLYGAAISAKGNQDDPHLKKARRALEGPQNRLRFFEGILGQIHRKSREGLAEDAAEDYLLSRCFLDPITKNPVEVSTPLIDQAKIRILSSYPDASQIREIARSNSTQLLFSVKKGDIFPDHPNELQLMLLSYINMYENIFKNQDCPPDFIIADDDALDGWLLTQEKGKAPDNIPSSVKNRENVFITAETQEEANAIYSQNSGNARTLQKARLRELHNKGAVKESEFKKRTQVFK